MITIPRLELVRHDSHATAEALQQLQTQLNAQLQMLRDHLRTVESTEARLRRRVEALEMLLAQPPQ